MPYMGTFDSPSSELKRDIERDIKDLMKDPDSYEYVDVSAPGSSLVTREDGTEYFSLLLWEFRGKNAYGGVVRHEAAVRVGEYGIGCLVDGVDLLSPGPLSP